MTKNKSIVGIIIICLVALIYWGYAWLNQSKELIPPSAEILADVENKFAGLTLEESQIMIQDEIEQLKFFLNFSNEDIESESKVIDKESVRYDKPFSILTEDDYKDIYQKYINSLKLFQRMDYPNSEIIIQGTQPLNIEPASLTVNKIIYKNGSVDEQAFVTEKMDQNTHFVQLKTAMLVESGNIEAEYEYYQQMDLYELSLNEPKIVTDDFTLALTAMKDNYIAFTRTGDLDIYRYEVLDETNMPLDSDSTTYYDIDFKDVATQTLKDLSKLSQQKFKNKKDLILQYAAYSEKFMQETDRISTRKFQGLYYGTPKTLVVYGGKNLTKNIVSATVQNQNTDRFRVVYIDNSKVSIVNMEGQFILEKPLDHLYQLTQNFYISDDQLYYLDQTNEALIPFAKGKTIKVMDDTIVVLGEKNIVIYQENLDDPIELEIIANDIGRVEFTREDDIDSGLFYVKQSDDLSLYNIDGQMLIEPKGQEIKKGDDETILVAPNFYSRDLPTEERSYYYLNNAGELFLTLTGYKEASPISNGMILAKKDRKNGFLDLKGNVAVPFIYESAEDFTENHALVKKDGLWGVINQQGNVVVPFQYKEFTLSVYNGQYYQYTLDGQSYTMKELLDNVH